MKQQMMWLLSIIKQNKILLVAIFPCLILIGILLVYFYNFHYGLAPENKDWGGFGSFINPFIAFTNAGITIVLSFMVYKLNRTLNMPLLTFKAEIKENRLKQQREIWQIANLGNSAALNLKVGYKKERDKEWVEPFVKCYSIGKDDSIDLDWLVGSVDVIGVYFTDIFDNGYVALVGDDVSEVRAVQNYKAIIINEKTYELSFFEELIRINSKSIRINQARNYLYSSLTVQTTSRITQLSRAKFIRNERTFKKAFVRSK